MTRLQAFGRRWLFRSCFAVGFLGMLLFLAHTDQIQRQRREDNKVIQEFQKVPWPFDVPVEEETKPSDSEEVINVQIEPEPSREALVCRAGSISSYEPSFG